MSFESSFRSSCFAAAALAGIALSAPSADACGGLFCSNANPVNQAAERIIFAQNDDGTVTAAIEIMYEGPAHQFAWVLPVPPGPVTVGVSSKNALDALDQASNPVYQLNTRADEDCDFNFPQAAGGIAESDDAEAEEPPSSPVTVVDEGNAGPYVWQQLMVDPDTPNPEDAALMWLETNDYDVTALGPELLRGYLVDGQNLIAFKLDKGKTTGSVRPVLLTYESERPIIPIKPTAVAANEDMGVKVWVLGKSRAIPTNYSHLELNQGMINWFDPNSNYNQIIIAAANEANKGHGFVTEAAGPAAEFVDILYPPFQEEQWDELRSGRFGSIQEFLQRTQQYFGGLDGFQDVFSDPAVVPLREGASAEQFISCIDCYFQADVPVRNEAYPETPYPGETDPIHDLNVMLFLNELHRLVIEPMELTAKMFEDHGSVTRMYTTLSPEEMTEDPEFDYNAHLPDVDNFHQADQILQCNADTEWRIELPQGMLIKGNGPTWPITPQSDFPFNLRITKLGTSGNGTIVTDNSGLIADMLTDLDIGEALPGLLDPPNMGPPDRNDDDADPQDDDDRNNDDDDPIGKGPDIGDMEDMNANASGGGCAVKPTSPEAGSFGFLALLGLGLMRRRRHN